MCGIIGIIGQHAVSERLLEGLSRLEYRGYDSAGIAGLVDGVIERRRVAGKLVNLANHLKEHPLNSTIGIAHTRWATHGVPTVANAHPHCSRKVAIVHNGIIENYQEFKPALEAQGYTFKSDTDTEVLAHLIDSCFQQTGSPYEAVQQAVRQCRGAYAIAVLFQGHPDVMVVARHGSPLALGYGEGEMYVGSDSIALAHLTEKVAYFKDGDVAVITASEATIYDAEGKAAVERPIKIHANNDISVSKGSYDHYMLKEIYEQPAVIQRTLEAFIQKSHPAVTLPTVPFAVKDIPRITMVACGTAFYACMVGKYWLETVARIPVEVDLASEFRYRQPPLPKGGVAIFISQSGETADTMAAHAYAKACGQHTIAIVNVPESSLARAADKVLYTLAGPEIGVASTKAFTTQLAVLACLTLGWAHECGSIEQAEVERLLQALTHAPAIMQQMFYAEETLKELASVMASARDALYLGRGACYPLALEGALKLKEISYIHAEGYAAGEMKHGPIALIDSKVPVVVLAPTNDSFEKTISNLQEVLARGGRIILLGDAEGAEKLAGKDILHCTMPTVDPFVVPLLYAVPLQLLAYHTAVLKGTDVDQPRNLAKSVTVE